MFSEDLSELDDSRSVFGYIAAVGDCHVLLSVKLWVECFCKNRSRETCFPPYFSVCLSVSLYPERWYRN